jgi:hypothetical protein
MRYFTAIGSTLLGTTAVVCLTLGLVASAASTAYALPLEKCERDPNRDICRGPCLIPTTCQDGDIPLTCACK